MSGTLIAFAIVMLVPLFVATWRTSILGLAFQGALLAWLALRHGAELSLDTALTVVDLAVLRMIVAPGALYGMMRRDREALARTDVVSANLFSWVIAVGLVVAAFRAADALVPVEGNEQMTVAVSSSAFVLGLFVLSTAHGTFSQIVGLLRIENAIALFELGRPTLHEAHALRAAKILLLLVSIGFYRWYLGFTREAEARVSEGAVL